MIDLSPPPIWLPPKPAIIRPAEPVKPLLAMPLTMGMVAKGQSAITVLSRSAILGNTTAGTSFTFSSVAIGTASSTRRVIVIGYMNIDGTSTSTNVSSMTIGGVTAAQDAVAGLGYASAPLMGSQRFCFSATVPTGTTATIVINASASTTRCGIWVVAIDKLTSTTPVDTANGSSTSGTSCATSTTLDYNSGGYVLGLCTDETSAGLLGSWSVLTGYTTGVVGTRNFSVAELSPSSSVLGTTPACACPASSRAVILTASYR